MAQADMPTVVESILLANSRIAVRLSTRTGQIQEVSQPRTKQKYIVNNYDIYTLSDGSSKKQLLNGSHGIPGKHLTVSNETKDVVTSHHRDGQALQLQCSNPDFPSLTITKTYRLQDNILSKTVHYQADNDTGRLFSVQSRVTLAPALRKKGRYFFPMDDGYKMAGPAVIDNTAVTRRIDLNRSNAMIIQALPTLNTVIAHYMYRIDGKIAFCGWPAVPASLQGDGWTAGFTQQFLSPTQDLTLETHLTIVSGDARDFHEQYYSLPEFKDFRTVAAPSWTKDLVLWAGGAHFSDYVNPQRDRTVEKMFTFGLIRRTARMLGGKDDLLYHVLIEPTVTGDYRFADPVPYYQAKTFKNAMPLDKYIAVIDRVKTTLPNLKVAVYTSRGAVLGESTFMKDHPEWIVHDSQGQPVPGGSGLGIPEYLVDITAPGYQEYALDQYKRIIDTLDTDWVYIDSSPFSFVNWKYKRVSTTADWIDFFKKIHDICRQRNVFLWLNSGWTSVLCSDIALFESYAIPQIEKNDWRKLAYMSFMSKLTRLRPSANVVIQGIEMPYYQHSGGYGTQMDFFGGNFGAGMVPCGSAYVRLGTELFDAVSTALKVHPSWWAGETKNLEIGTLRKQGTVILPIIWHGGRKTAQTVTLNTDQLSLVPNVKLFTIETAATMPETIDLTTTPPYQNNVTEVRSVQVQTTDKKSISRTIKLGPMDLTYLTITTVPAFVYAADGQRAYLLLPDNKKVHIAGTAPTDADTYTVTVTSQANTAQILLHRPDDWSAASLTINRVPTSADLLRIKGEQFLRVDVPTGESTVTVARTDHAAIPEQPFTDVAIDTWQQIIASFYYHNLNFTPTGTDDHVAVDLSLKNRKTPTGSFIIDVFPHTLDNGMAFDIQSDSDGQLSLTADLLNADAPVTITLNGNRHFSATDPTWVGQRYLRFIWTPRNPDATLSIRDLHLVSEPTGKAHAVEPAKRRIILPYVKTPPDMTRTVIDPCWDHIEAQTDFFSLSGPKADSKTTVQACYGDHAIYFFIKSYEPIVTAAPPTPRDGAVYNNSCNEIYLNVDPEHRDYRHFIFDSAGNQYDAKHTKALGADIAWNGQWQVVPLIGYNVAWTAKIRIPFTDLDATPKPGDHWAVNIARTIRAGEHSSWSPSPGSWHNPDNFGILEFDKKE